MDFDKYTFSTPYPLRKHFTCYHHYKGGEYLGKTTSSTPMVKGAVVEKVVDENAYKDARLGWYYKKGKLEEQFKQDLFDELGIPAHPKREKFYALCYEQGHSGGYSEVYNVAWNWVGLLED